MNDPNAKAGLDSRAEHEALQGLGPWKPTRLAWMPIPLLAMAIIAARAAGLSESYTSETLTFLLSVTFYTLVSLGTLFLIGRSFLLLGTPGLLLLECGVVLWSLAGTVGDAVSHGDANINVTIFNMGILVAGVCHLAGAILSLRPQRVLRARPQWLGAGCALVLGVLWLITQAALANWLPVFFIPGQGGTPVRYCVLIAAIAMFVLSSGLLLADRRQARTPFTSWYAFALVLLAVGLFGVMIQLSLGSVVNWLGRTAQWLGGVYLLLAAVAALRQSGLPLLPAANKSRPERYRYGVAVSIVAAAAAVRLVLSPAIGTKVPFLTFHPAVILAALYGGARAGLLATVFSALIVDFFWVEPVNRFTAGSPTDWMSLLFFFLSCTMISFIVEAMHKARDRLVLHQDHLEELVKERTVKLEQEVVERKQAEEALRESEKRYKELSAELEERVRERTAELERKNRELQDFAFIASHDLHEPLRKIQTFGSLLASKSADLLGQEQLDYISRITRSANRMRDLLAALLNYSRIEARGESFKPTPLNDAVRDAISDMEVEIKAAGARLSVGSLPTVMGDPNQIRQMFQNLFENAIKYRQTEVVPVIQVQCEESHGQCRIFVEDNGIGFDEKYVEKIFQPFQRLHGKHEYSGTGIGLAICRKVVERHGGTITAKSTPGKGSTFIVTLPVSPAKS